MARIDDVACYILKHGGPMTAMKLQKLVYYSQAWSLVWDVRPLFRARVEAWANGPVVPALYRKHRGKFKLHTGDIVGNANGLDQTERGTVDAVLQHYGKQSSQWLSELTHQEAPWRDARKGLPDGTRGHEEITHAAMHEYYESLL